MICEILQPIFDALDGEFRFHGLVCGGNWGAGRRAKRKMAMPKICIALNKEKGNLSSTISFLLNQQINSTTFSIDGTTKSGDGTTFQVDGTTFSDDGTTFFGCLIGKSCTIAFVLIGNRKFCLHASFR